MDARRDVVSARDLASCRAGRWGSVPLLAGASFRSANFAVEAPTREIAATRGRTGRGMPDQHRQGLAGPRAAHLEHAVPDPGQADRRRGRRIDLVRLQPRPGHRSAHDGRGPARPHPGLGLAPRSDAHHLRQLFRRSHAALGRRRGFALERRRARAAAPRPDRHRSAGPPRRASPRASVS